MKQVLIIGLVVTILLSGCNGVGKTSSPLPTVALDSQDQTTNSTSVAQTTETRTPDSSPNESGNAAASGTVTSLHQAQFVANSSGSVQTVSVTVGEEVKSGSILVVLSGREKMQAAVDAAQLELLSARQELDAVNRDADKVRAAAQVRLAEASKALDDAVRRREYRNYRNGSESTINSAKADYILAKDYLQKAQDAYSYYQDLPDENINKAGALTALSAAQKAYDKALSNLNYLTGMPSQLDVDQAEANLQAAKAEYANAQKAFDRVKNGPDPETLALAQARVSNAESQLLASQASLDEMEIKAPFDGSVGRLNVHPGDWVSPGQLILAMVDLKHMQVETTDLSERDVVKVKAGQSVKVFVKALGVNVPGKVAQIAPMADTLGGDVVYKTIITLEEIPQGLLPGMSVDVKYQ
ncbi:MAG: HlyD family efflux transporter periplasmic adaptor subunit [Leptolinea sp.]|jgi:multidrug resistance efflux pump|nr:HlyD family efflux transporter periplasmic adaptor subunit [Leptolinea sp.]